MIVAISLAIIATGCRPDNPFERGPLPTDASLAANVGPFDFASLTVADADTPGFGAATIYYPTSTSDGTFGGVAISPGFTASQSAIKWFGPRLASNGFVVITIDTNSIFDDPWSRGVQLLSALDYLTGSSEVRERVDSDRLAVMGHSMGGGGALEAAKARPSLQAAIPLQGWSFDPTWPEIQSPTLVLGGQNDTVAPVANHSKPFYESLPQNLPKAYVEIAGGDHFVANGINPTIARYVVSWLKRFVDNDLRYQQFLCPAPPTGDAISAYAENCPVYG